MKWRTIEAFAMVMSVGVAMLFVLFVVFRSQYDPGASSPNQLNQDNGKLLEWVLASPLAATLVGYRDAFGRMIQVGVPGQGAPRVAPRTIEQGALALYLVGLSGVAAALALLLSLRLGLLRGNVEQTVTAVAAWWTGTVSWTLTRYVAAPQQT